MVTDTQLVTEKWKVIADNSLLKTHFAKHKLPIRYACMQTCMHADVRGMLSKRSAQGSHAPQFTVPHDLGPGSYACIPQ